MSEEQKVSKLDEEVEAHSHRIGMNDEPAAEGEGDEVEAHGRLDGRVDGRSDGRSDARTD